MRLLTLFAIVLFVLAPTASIAQDPTVSRDIVLELRCPNGAVPQLRIANGGMGSVSIPKFGTFGFSPTLRAGDPTAVDVELFDLSQSARVSVGRVEVRVGGGEVQSATSPEFGVKVLNVM